MVDECLKELPRCSKEVVIASPEYKGSHYNCEIFIEAKDLLNWAESQEVWSSNEREQAAREALPIWLSNADLYKGNPSYLSDWMYEVLGPYVPNFVDAGTAKIFCLECKAFVADIEQRIENQQRTGGEIFYRVTGTDVWTCPQGHQLLYKKYDCRIHVNRARPINKVENKSKDYECGRFVHFLWWIGIPTRWHPEMHYPPFLRVKAEDRDKSQC